MLVVFEGHDGVGKSSVIREVHMRLELEGCKVASISNPDPKLKDIRKSIDSSGNLEASFRYYLACSLYSAATADIALQAGAQVVLMDRFFYSTIVSHEARGLVIQESFFHLFPRVDLGFWVRTTELTRQRRLQKRRCAEAHDRSSLNEDFIRIADEAYKRLGLIQIDNDGLLRVAVDAVTLRIREKLQSPPPY
jgi:thymidylate kinase